MIQDGGFRGACGSTVVVARDRVQQLRQHGRVDRTCALLDQPQPEVDMTEQTALLRLPEGRATLQLAGAADVVQQRCTQQQVGAQPRVQLCGLAAERRHTDRVLEQPACVAVVPLRAGGGQRSQRLA